LREPFNGLKDSIFLYNQIPKWNFIGKTIKTKFMKTKLLLITASLLMISAFFILNSCKKEDNNNEETIQVFGSEFVPYVFTDNEKIVGIDADIAAEAMQNAGVDMESL